MLDSVAPKIVSINACMMHRACSSPDDDLHISFGWIKVGRVRWAKRLPDFIVPAERLKSSIQEFSCIVSEDSTGRTTSCHTLLQASRSVSTIRSGMAADDADVGIKE